MLQQKVYRRSGLKIQADTFNTVLDAAQDLKDRRASMRVRPGRSSSRGDLVLVRNDSGEDCLQFDVLGLDVPVILPEDNENEFMQNWAMSAVLPVEDDHEKKFCILQEPIPDGAFGKALIVGVSPVEIVREAGEDGDTAGVVDGEVYLVAGKRGANIIWEESAADGDPRWALVSTPMNDKGGGGNATARVATTSSSTAHSGLSAIDGITPVDGDIIFDRNNVTGSLRGLWVAHSGAWTRDADQEIVSGMLITVREGTANAGKVWVLTTADPITVGTTSLSFTQIGPNTTVSLARLAGSGLTHSGLSAVDGVTPSTLDLIFDISSGVVYSASSGAWATAVASPSVVYVTEGNSNGPLTYAKNSAGTWIPIGGVYK